MSPSLPPSPTSPEPPFDTEWADYITCPKCGYVDQEVCEYPRELDRDGDTTSVDCSECGADFTVSLCVSYNYTTRLAEPAPNA